MKQHTKGSIEFLFPPYTNLKQKIVDLTVANNEEQYVNRLINISKPKIFKDTQTLFYTFDF